MDTTQDEKEEEVANATVQDQIKQLGEKDINEDLHKKLTIWTEFNLEHIAHIDDSIHVKSLSSHEVWNDSNAFPTGDAFTQEFR
eukprot:8165160-Ditylum_brightwellii.AAC.2